jgi:hypothetical protein
VLNYIFLPPTLLDHALIHFVDLNTLKEAVVGIVPNMQCASLTTTARSGVIS